jgi:hypothetical protein
MHTANSCATANGQHGSSLPSDIKQSVARKDGFIGEDQCPSESRATRSRKMLEVRCELSVDVEALVVASRRMWRIEGQVSSESEIQARVDIGLVATRGTMARN